jgi:lipid II isoglutaminyl synthase (glutamine-hydrolysing)
VGGGRRKAHGSVIRLVIAIAIGRLAGQISRFLGRGGSAIPGLVAGRIAPRAIERLAGSVRDGVVVVTGTNGKTTTTKMIVAALEADGRRVVTNRTGSNLERGIVTALIDRASWRGVMRADIAVFEADEAAVRPLSRQLAPRLLVVTNLARDQLDRYGELDTTEGHVAAALGRAGGSVLNADDPRVAGLGAGDVAYYGAVPSIRALMPSDRELHGLAEAVPRPGPLQVEVLEAKANEAAGQTVTLAHDDARVTMRLHVPGTYNAYNAAAAFAAALRLGVVPATIHRAFEGMEAPFGRGQVTEHRGRRVIVILAKNPSGLNQAIRLLGEVAASAGVLVAINDEIADGRDVSWLWDARVEELAATAHRFGASGTRAADMALRFKYAGVEAWAEPDLGVALDRLVSGVDEGGTAYVVPTYTAMLALLDLLLPGVPRREVWM